MYTKLAIQNMKKSIRNYVIYFVTITLTAAMMYSFLALGFSKEVLSMSENMSMLTSGILGMSVLVALIASFCNQLCNTLYAGTKEKGICHL